MHRHRVCPERFQTWGVASPKEKRRRAVPVLALRTNPTGADGASEYAEKAAAGKANGEKEEPTEEHNTKREKEKKIEKVKRA